MPAANALVVLRLVADHGANELRQRRGHAIGRDVGRAECSLEQTRIVGGLRHLRYQRGKIVAHLNGVLDRLQDQVFERGGALVGEEMSALVELGIGKAHTVPLREAALKAFAHGIEI